MLSQERIDYFLKTDYNDIKEGEYNVLVKYYFKAVKENWYEEDKKGNNIVKVWNESKVEEFWKLIRRHTMVNGKMEGCLDFSWFIFPKFGNTYFWGEEELKAFWNKEKPKAFTENTRFEFSKFMGEAKFDGIQFAKESDFFNAQFMDKTSFRNAIFTEKAIFRVAEFMKEADFESAEFTEKADFEFAKFKGKAEFWIVKFMGEASFESVEFTKEADFHDVKFSEKANFNEVEFKGEAIFVNIIFKRVIFKSFYSNRLPPKILFRSIDFTSEATFNRFNLSSVTFSNCDFYEAVFTSCEWNLKDRLILVDENRDYKDSENHYRQIKKLYESKKNWELSGMAYISEMEMRKMRYKSEFNWKPLKGWNARLSYCFFKIYEILGLYTHSFIRPFIWFCLSTVVIFPLFIYSDWCFFTSSCEFNKDILKYSFKNAIPFYKIEDNGFFWWSLFQKLFSTILITFFILALRKRFKQ